ncbi:MAG TPA: pyridoxamine 5'-phosphate oxidase [Candidatus Saccharimonadales bacterium]|nr:pyridoxamine 5'-phosphate oxidase [Candidatus Saccharimonadales bacterium]
MPLSDLRRDYRWGALRRRDLLPDPIRQFQKWFDEAVLANAVEPNAMTLATASAAGQPSSRTVLLKGLDERGFVFFTNYEARKGRELAENPRAALTFYWREVERQVCVCGMATRVGREESEAYFNSRPSGSRWAAWVSKQGEVIPNREFLEENLLEVKTKFPGDKIPLPPYWGGYFIVPATVEFWQGGASRLHDRFRYTRQSEGGWLIERLAP